MPPKSRIVETRSRSEACIAEVRSQSAKKMDDIWQQLQQKHGRNNLYIEDEELESFATKKELRLNGQGEPVFSPCHFKLLPKRILEDYPIHEAMLSHRDPTLQDYADYDQTHVGYTGGSVSGWLSHEHHADQITSYLENQILEVPRKVPGQDRAHHGVRLIKLTNLELVLDPDPLLDVQTPIEPYCRPDDTLVDAEGISPHVTQLARHNVKGDDRLLVGEVGLIVKLLQERFSQEQFKTIASISVLMLSFMGEQHGRIIHGCCDGTNLTFHVSKLYSFKRKDDAPWELFIRLSSATPVTPTK
ncbi:hypothetical protein V8E54_004996 [Elaphomyces granulatus]